MTKRDSISLRTFALLLIVMTLGVGTTGCAFLIEPFKVVVSQDDTTPPNVAAISNVFGWMEPDRVYQVRPYMPMVMLTGIAGDQESGIQEILADLSLEMACQLDDGREDIRPFTEDASASIPPRSPGTVVLNIGGAGPIRLVPAHAIEMTCGTEPFLRFYGILTVTARNHVGLQDTEEFQLNAIACGRRGETCCSGECASTEQCRGGICSIPCRAGSRCTARDAIGECRNGQRTCATFEVACVQGTPSAENQKRCQEELLARWGSRGPENVSGRIFTSFAGDSGRRCRIPPVAEGSMALPGRTKGLLLGTTRSG